MNSLCIINGTAVLPNRLLSDTVVVCRDERIAYVGTARGCVPASAKIIDASLVRRICV
jgi:N-acetylglucosamine-6-phosphate deacetylase